jgi:hypothetical protein
MRRLAVSLIAGAVLTLAIAPAVQAQEIDIQYERFVLDNGLTLIVHEDRPHRLRPPVRAPDVQRQRELR